MLASLLSPIRIRSMSAFAGFRPFKVALVQLGNTGPSKEKNIQHAQKMILKAAGSSDSAVKPNLIVLPVRQWSLSTFICSE